MAFSFPRSRQYAASLVEARDSRSPGARCAVINCKNSVSDRDDDVRFYVFPDDPTERAIWVALLARVDRSRKPWQIQQSKTHYVCSKHFLGNRRFLLPGTDHYFPSIFPAILNENCLANVSSQEEKFALIPRAAGFYKHNLIVKEDGTPKVTAHRETLPELDPDGMKWSELQEMAYTEIYLPFTTEFNNLIAQIRLQEKKTMSTVTDITRRINCMETRMKLGIQRMLEVKEDPTAACEVNIYNTAQDYPEQGQVTAPVRSRPVDKPRERTKTHSFVSGRDDIRIPIDVTMPSIIKNWRHTELVWPKINEKVFALDKFGNWLVSVVVGVDSQVSTLRVKLQGSTRESIVPLGHVAYSCPHKEQVQLGCRVLAGNSSPKPGVVMEYPKWQNSNRYLILFENGRWAYHDHCSIFLICKQTSQPYQHVKEEIQETVREFFMTTEHPLLRVAVGQRISAERENQWFDSEVVSLDGNLIEVAFLRNGTKLATEWLYAGSERLQEIFILKHPSAPNNRKHARRKIASKANQPYVEYTDDAMDVITLSDDDDDQDEPQNQKKNTARKSTSQAQMRRKIHNSMVDRDPGFLGQVMKEVVTPKAQTKEFEPHTCGPACLPVNDDPLSHTDYSPYLMPYIMAWKRLLVDSSEGKKVVYKAPCGRSLRSDAETANYLLQTGSKIRIDQFCFDPEFDMFAVWEPLVKNVFIADVTKKEEPYPISFVNSVDSTREGLVPYWPIRRPSKAVRRSIVLDEDFLPCCACEDECLDRSKCQCQCQTVAASDSISGQTDPNAGYTFRSLPELLQTGIYECNYRCSCKAQCANKVAQNGVQVRMQIFKTQKKGLGVRTVHDIPKGRFVCTYAGTLLTDREAEASGQDTYFAELDLIDVVCKCKEGYESSASDIEDDLYSPDDSDEEYTPKNLKPDALRKLYFGKEDSYVMDALEGGNIGRYFNHSCDPNIYVQNVFVDTHDLRLPWVAFFTERLIKAGEELTWDYSYVVGSVKGKRLLCYCNASNCRKRLL